MNNLDEIIAKITDFLRSEAKTETIIGKEFKLGEFTCVPVISIGMGFGGGEGKGNSAKTGEGTGTGAGGGLGMGPVGFLVTRHNEIQFVPVRSEKGIHSALEKLPDLLEKVFDKSKKKEKETVE